MKQGARQILPQLHARQSRGRCSLCYDDAVFMTAKRVAVYLVCATMLAAWLASAAGVMNQPEAPAPAPAPAPVQTTGTESLAEEVQAQAGRLRERLASAPLPQRPARNPFQFAPRVTAAPKRVVAAAPPPPAVESVPVLPEPQLSLVGIAEDAAATGPVRTAIVTIEGGETLLLRAGEFIGARYRVKAIGTDAVELSDLTNGAVRRLVLR